MENQPLWSLHKIILVCSSLLKYPGFLHGDSWKLHYLQIIFIHINPITCSYRIAKPCTIDLSVILYLRSSPTQSVPIPRAWHRFKWGVMGLKYSGHLSVYLSYQAMNQISFPLITNNGFILAPSLALILGTTVIFPWLVLVHYRTKTIIHAFNSSSF